MSSYIYFIQRDDGAVKIGITTDMYHRISALRTEHGNIKLLGVVAGGRVKERILHLCLSEARLDGEWFKMTDEIKDIIEQYAAPHDEPRRYQGNKKMISIRLDTRHLELLDRASKIPGSKFAGLNRTAIIEKCLDEGLDWIKLDGDNNNGSD